MLYRAFRRRGHPAMACLRVAYGPRVRPTGEQPALDAMLPDLGDVMHECTCSGCDACIRDALWVAVVDQTYGVAIGQEHGPHWLLLVSRHEPFAELDPDQCVDLVARWLGAVGWRPDDGGEQAAQICRIVEQGAVREYERGKLRERRREEIARGREFDDLLAERRATGTTFLG